MMKKKMEMIMNKSLYDISWQIDEETYRKDEAYSYSTIARFNKEGFKNLDKLYDKIKTPSLLFGSIVDSLLTESKEEFERKYTVAELPDLSDSLVQIVRTLFDGYGETCRSLALIPDEAISYTCEQCGYYAASKFSSYRVKKVREEGAVYYNTLYLALGKTLVSNTDYQSALECIHALMTSDNTREYFSMNNPFGDIEKFFQLKFKGSYNDIPLRCMADLLCVDNEEKKIIPCDIKTSSKPEWEFYKSFLEFNYWIQAQLYWYIIRQNLDKDDIFKDYTLENYRFIVINRSTLCPLVWEYPDTRREDTVWYNEKRPYRCRNWREIVTELDTYMKGNYKVPLNIGKINNIVEFIEND